MLLDTTTKDKNRDSSRGTCLRQNEGGPAVPPNSSLNAPDSVRYRGIKKLLSRKSQHENQDWQPR